MNADYLKKKYPNHIANEYSESKELSLANFDGHDMMDFAEQYANEKVKVYGDSLKERSLEKATLTALKYTQAERIKELEEFCELVTQSYKLTTDKRGYEQVHYSLSVKATELLTNSK